MLACVVDLIFAAGDRYYRLDRTRWTILGQAGNLSNHTLFIPQGVVGISISSLQHYRKYFPHYTLFVNILERYL